MKHTASHISSRRCKKRERKKKSSDSKKKKKEKNGAITAPVTLTGRAAAGKVFHTRLSSCGKPESNQLLFWGRGW